MIIEKILAHPVAENTSKKKTVRRGKLVELETWYKRKTLIPKWGWYR